MLFKRRIAQTFFQKARNAIWPKMGWRRVLHYYKYRSIRIPAGEYSIASGLAFGCAISWTPTFGTHLLQCAIFSWIARANWVAAFLGTAFGNPWTMPALMFIAYQVGKALYIGFGYGDLLADHAGPITIELLKTEGMKIFMPTLIGGYVMALATFPLFYFPFYYMVKGARVARRLRIERKVHKEALEITGQPK